MTGWDRDYLANKEEYLKLFDNAMQKENERNIEFLEKHILKIINRKYAVTCASGTDALRFALMALNLGPGDEINDYKLFLDIYSLLYNDGRCNTCIL